MPLWVTGGNKIDLSVNQKSELVTNTDKGVAISESFDGPETGTLKNAYGTQLLSIFGSTNFHPLLYTSVENFVTPAILYSLDRLPDSWDVASAKCNYTVENPTITTTIYESQITDSESPVWESEFRNNLINGKWQHQRVTTETENLTLKVALVGWDWDGSSSFPEPTMLSANDSLTSGAGDCTKFVKEYLSRRWDFYGFTFSVVPNFGNIEDFYTGGNEDFLRAVRDTTTDFSGANWLDLDGDGETSSLDAWEGQIKLSKVAWTGVSAGSISVDIGSIDLDGAGLQYDERRRSDGL